MKLEINPNRIELDEAYMQMAEIWAKRSKANRLQVGALLVKDTQIISDGYNGMPQGTAAEDECCEFDYYDGNRDREQNYTGEIKTKPEVLHAEANAILKLASNGGVSSAGATLYTTYSPCPECAKLIKQAKIGRVVYRNNYRRPEGVELLMKWGVQCDQVKGPPVLVGYVDNVSLGGENVTVSIPINLPDEAPAIIAEEPQVPSMEPFRAIRNLKYLGVMEGQGHGLGQDVDDPANMFILNDQTGYAKSDGNWRTWEPGTMISAQVTDSHHVQRATRHDTYVG